MKKKPRAVLSAFVVMMGANVMANTVWDGEVDTYWDNPLNWQSDALPSAEIDSADIRHDGDHVVVTNAVSATGLQIKAGGSGALLEIETGGTVTMVNSSDGRAFITRNSGNVGTVRVNMGGAWKIDRPGGVSNIRLGDDTGTEGYLQVYGGSVVVSNNLDVGGSDADATAYGEFEITGGSMVAGDKLTFAETGVGTAVGKFHGGVTESSSLVTGEGADLDFQNDGVLVLNGDVTAQIEALATNGVVQGSNPALDWGYDGSANGVAWDYDTQNTGRTTVWARPLVPPIDSVGDVSIRIDGTSIITSFAGEEGGTYALQRNLDLVNGIWSNIVEDITGIGTINITNDITGTNVFYRMILQ